MLAYAVAVAVGEDNSALDSRNRGWSGENENTVCLRKGFRLSSPGNRRKTAPIWVDFRFSDSSRAPAKTQTSFGVWRLTDGLKRIPPSTSAFKVHPVLRTVLFLTTKESLLTKSLPAYRVASSHALVYFRETHTALFFLLCDVIRKAGAFRRHVIFVENQTSSLCFALWRNFPPHFTSLRARNLIFPAPNNSGESKYLLHFINLLIE